MNAVDSEANHDINHDNIQDKKDENEDDMECYIDVDTSCFQMTWVEV